MDDTSSPQSSSPNSMSWGVASGLYFSPVSNATASSFDVCGSLRSVGNAAFRLFSGIQQGSGSARSTPS
eukprot:8152598-Prorocentrum_lima.AAC.1